MIVETDKIRSTVESSSVTPPARFTSEDKKAIEARHYKFIGLTGIRLEEKTFSPDFKEIQSTSPVPNRIIGGTSLSTSVAYDPRFFSKAHNTWGGLTFPKQLEAAEQYAKDIAEFFDLQNTSVIIGSVADMVEMIKNIGPGFIDPIKIRTSTQVPSSKKQIILEIITQPTYGISTWPSIVSQNFQSSGLFMVPLLVPKAALEKKRGRIILA